MPIVIGADIGTTTITALAVDAGSGELLAGCTSQNDAEITAPEAKERGRSEWSPERIAQRVTETIRTVARQVQARQGELAGLALAGQQHGVLLLDDAGRPVTPFINWQDRRADDILPATGRTYAGEAATLAGPDAPLRTGCVLAPGFLGTTLFWMIRSDALPAEARTACFITDYVAALLAGGRPVTDPTNAASSGLLDVRTRRWDPAVLHALGVPSSLLPDVRETGSALGTLSAEGAASLGLPAGLPLFVGIGDNQASFLGSMADRRGAALINVGTGAQVAAFVDDFAYAPPAETRPFPGSGYLLVHAGLSGGRSWALLEQFFREVGAQLLGVEVEQSLYSRMAQLALDAPRGACGMQCDPTFAGSRADPDHRASWTGLSADNFTPALFIRSLLEGMARGFHESCMAIEAAGAGKFRRLVGAGNGVRKNTLLARIIEEEFGFRLAMPRHKEESAYGAALVAAVGAGLFPDLPSACRLIRYDTEE